MKRFFPLQIREADGEAACEAASMRLERQPLQRKK
jgi:hypothetical protein